MTTTIFINKNERHSKNGLINEIANAIFGNQEQSFFSEEFVPSRCKVPTPKIQNFANYLLNEPKLLWAIQYENVTVGFILIHDRPHQNAMGIGINSKFSKKGVATEAFHLVNNHEEINYPLFGYTSCRNIAAQKFIEKIGFKKYEEEIDFCGEKSFKYVFEL